MLSQLMVMLVAVNETSHPASRNWPMESSSCVASAGTTWPCHVVAGRLGRSSLASWVKCITVPAGVWIAMGSCIGCLLHMGIEVEKKCTVQLESAMA